MEIILECTDLFLKITVLSVCTVYLYNSIMKLVNGNKSIQYYFYLLYYFFYIFPIILQLCFQNHEYIIFWRANEAMSQPLPNIVYDVFVLIFAIVIMKSGKRAEYTRELSLTYNKLLIRVCTIVIIVSFVYTLVMSGFSVLTSYGMAYLSDTLDINESLIGCGIISYLILLGQKKYMRKIHLLLMTVLVIGLIWIVGKRYIIAETLIMSIYVLSMVGVIEGKKFIRYLAFGVIAVIAFCIIYGITFKGNFNSFVDYFKVDMSRQYTLVYQFYCNSIGRQISVGSFDAVLWLIGWWIPRTIWPNKPYPFVNQLTYSLVSSSNTPSGLNMGWATTCGIFSDLFDSFSFFGLGLGILLFITLFRIINNTGKTYYKILFMYLVVRLLTVQISSAIIPIVVLLVIVFLSDKFGRNNVESA